MNNFETLKKMQEIAVNAGFYKVSMRRFLENEKKGVVLNLFVNSDSISEWEKVLHEKAIEEILDPYASCDDPHMKPFKVLESQLHRNGMQIVIQISTHKVPEGASKADEKDIVSISELFTSTAIESLYMDGKVIRGNTCSKNIPLMEKEFKTKAEVSKKDTLFGYSLFISLKKDQVEVWSEIGVSVFGEVKDSAMF